MKVRTDGRRSIYFTIPFEDVDMAASRNDFSPLLHLNNMRRMQGHMQIWQNPKRERPSLRIEPCQEVSQRLVNHGRLNRVNRSSAGGSFIPRE